MAENEEKDQSLAMYLKRLELIGFKSFADRTEFTYPRSVTAIVGPNGCGKSNVVDAFKWIFGEQSAKGLRGEEMKDVIFNGTQTRKPTGLAEVTVVFDNSDRTLDIDYAEVAITRRLGDIIDEVEKRMHRVKVQAGKARKYREHFDRLRELRVQAALREFSASLTEREELSSLRLISENSLAQKEELLGRLREGLDR